MNHCPTCRCEEKAKTIKLPLDYLPEGYEVEVHSYGVEIVNERGWRDDYWTHKFAEDTDGYQYIQFGEDADL